MSITLNKLAEYTHWKEAETKLINNRPVRFRDVCVHEITMGDVEDPDIFVAGPIWDWQESHAGQWCMEHAVDKPYWVRLTEPMTYGYIYRIMARLSEQNETFWRLKWGGINK
jgi:hypothetical protein